ncbi:MAG: hypothetical protein DWQ08_04680, partial [Proteobacteria bacterium]
MPAEREPAATTGGSPVVEAGDGDAVDDAPDNRMRLEMARAYRDLGDDEGASAFLALVDSEGTGAERAEAKRLCQSPGT